MSVAIRPQSISAIGSFTALSLAVADYLAIDPSRCSGLGGSPLRTTVENIAGADGAFVEDAFDAAQIVTLGGDLAVTSTGLSSEDGYFAAVDALLGSLKSALEAMKTAEGALVHAGGVASVRFYAPIDITWQSFWVCQVTFSLVVVTSVPPLVPGIVDTTAPSTPSSLTATAV